MLRILAIITLTLGSILLFACGGGDDDGDGGDAGAGGTPSQDDDSDDRPSGSGPLTSADMCKLLTKAEVEAAVGNKVEDGAPDILISCDWSSDPLETSVGIYLLPTVNRQLCDNAVGSDASYKRDSSFSDPAFTSYNPGFGGTADVVVCAGRGQFQLVVSGGLDDTNNEQKLRGAAIDLMKKALARQ